MCNALRILVHSVLQAIVLNKEMMNDGEKQFERIGIIYQNFLFLLVVYRPSQNP
jgi:hypothetical protein